MEQNSSLLGILSGKDSVKLDVSVNFQSIALFAAAVFIAVIAAVVVAKKVD